MKEILIVGGTGFLGYHVSKALINKFKIISLSTSSPKKIRFLKKVKYYKVDISNKNLFKKIEKKLLNISYVINFGGHVDHKSKSKVFNSHYILNDKHHRSHYTSKQKPPIREHWL